jgi:hypothetical protein
MMLQKEKIRKNKKKNAYLLATFKTNEKYPPTMRL